MGITNTGFAPIVLSLTKFMARQALVLNSVVGVEAEL